MKRHLITALCLLACAPALADGPPDPQPKLRLSDDDLEAAVVMALITEERVRANAIDVDVERGVATLSGTVDNLLAKRRALRLTRTIRGVLSVVDTLKVDSPAIGDELLEHRATAALLYDPAVDVREVTAKASGGTVTLSGTVDSFQTKWLAERAVERVRGARAVDNQLVVEFGVDDRSDLELKSEVERWIESSVWIDDTLIAVSVDEAKVTLEGYVGSAVEKHWATLRAWVPGVKAVDASALKVRHWLEDPDRRDQRHRKLRDPLIRTSIERALRYDPRVTAPKVTVKVKAGMVSLRGVVTDLRAKRAAEQDARNTLGVWSVQNLLRVRPRGPVLDTAIAKAIQAALKRDAYLDARALKVRVARGHATLSGVVDTPFERQHAGTIAATAAGVVDVSNLITVAPAETWERDLLLRQTIEAQLRFSPFVAADGIQVRVADRVVTLRGSVQTWHAWQAAEAKALQSGARRVINELSVQYGPSGFMAKPTDPTPNE